MAEIGSMTLTGASGKDYYFTVYSYDTNFNNINAVYYISKRTVKSGNIGSHSAIYVGETNILKDRLISHHKKGCFSQHEANAVSILRESNDSARITIEMDLINSLSPPCND